MNALLRKGLRAGRGLILLGLYVGACVGVLAAAFAWTLAIMARM